MYTSIRAAARTVEGAITAALENDPVLGLRFNPGLGGLMRVTLQTPEEMSANNIDGLSVFVYHVLVDEQSRNRPMLRPTPEELVPSPLPLRLRILFTPVVTSLDPNTVPAVEQEILGKVIETWHSRPFLRGADLVDELSGTDVEYAIRIETLDLESLSRIWDALEDPFRLSVSYELSIVDIETARYDLPAAPVENIASPVGTIQPGEVDA